MCDLQCPVCAVFHVFSIDHAYFMATLFALTDGVHLSMVLWTCLSPYGFIRGDMHALEASPLVAPGVATGLPLPLAW